MRLLNAHTLELEYFPSDPPPYVAISHRWGAEKDEVSFQDMLQLVTQPSAKNKPGFAKILGCVMQAKKHSLNYIWIDTCCIDKTNNTELQEAINSMWSWYQDCDRCFVYMNDLPEESRSFAKDWERIGKKANRNIMKGITHITGIPEGVLSDGETTSFSVATRMTWASSRSTTKKEDKAYSLMGIFDITLPIIYGGRENVFVKFQKEIMNRHPDQSIFAWTVKSPPPTATAGLLTPSPAYFADVNEISDEDFVKDFAHMIKPDSRPPTHYSHTNLGIRITLPMKLRRRRQTSLAYSNRRGFSYTGQFSLEESAAPAVPSPTTNTHRHLRTHRVGHRPTPSRSRDARRERPTPILVPEGSRVPTRFPPPPHTDTPPTIRRGSRTNRVTSRDARHNRPISIEVPLPPERLRDLNPESPSPGSPNQRSMTPRAFEGQISKVWYNPSYRRAHSQRPQFRHTARSLSPRLVSSDFASPQVQGRKPKPFKPRAVPTSRLRSHSLAAEPSASSPERIEHSAPVGSYRAQTGHSKPSSQVRSHPRKATSPSHIPAVDHGRAASRDRGRNRSQKPVRSPKQSPSRPPGVQRTTPIIHVTPADGGPYSRDSPPVSPVPTVPSSPADERSASSLSAPPTPPQIPATLTTRFTPNLDALFGSQKDSDPFESSPNHAVELTSTSKPPTPVSDKSHAVPINGGGFVLITASPVEQEAPFPGTSSQQLRSSTKGTSLFHRFTSFFSPSGKKNAKTLAKPRRGHPV
ncbi:heterokaryon incompatibility protein-domain-containing protein [Melanogaster broomeanus]|nr:heterokaryon incompatibility protein-domain-containing protein [Melanogaster broomeanus]